jgi:hypothetical protein
MLLLLLFGGEKKSEIEDRSSDMTQNQRVNGRKLRYLIEYFKNTQGRFFQNVTIQINQSL